MKRFLLILTALMLAVSLCACGNDNQSIAADGQLVAGVLAGNNAVDYSFAYPEEWSLARNDGTIELQFDYNPSDSYANYATYTVLAFTLSDTNQTVKEYWDSQKERVEGTFSDYKELDIEEYDTPETGLDDSPAMKVKYSFKHLDMTYISEQIICVRMGSVYLLTLTVPEDGYDYSSSIITAVKDSFVFA